MNHYNLQFIFFIHQMTNYTLIGGEGKIRKEQKMFNFFFITLG
ncbi:hypothetical protein GM3708_895 [Geminocystis sp. NIES-3708]|nr:hypothetical protein GM3708_895 [Geminocystis sp. NIES-3708]